METKKKKITIITNLEGKKHIAHYHIFAVCDAKQRRRKGSQDVSLRLVEHPLSNNAHSITIFLLRYEWRVATDWVLIAGQGTDILLLCRSIRVRMRVSLYSIAWCVSSFALSFFLPFANQFSFYAISRSVI